MRKLILVGALAALLGGCSFATFSSKLDVVAHNVETYAPLVGKDLLNIGGILIAAECSPALTPVTDTATKILNIVAPNNSAANAVQSFLATNQAVASELCPLVTAIKASVGQVPSGTPSQTISVPATTQAALYWKQAMAKPAVVKK